MKIKSEKGKGNIRTSAYQTAADDTGHVEICLKIRGKRVEQKCGVERGADNEGKHDPVAILIQRPIKNDRCDISKSSADQLKGEGIAEYSFREEFVYREAPYGDHIQAKIGNDPYNFNDRKDKRQTAKIIRTKPLRNKQEEDYPRNPASAPNNDGSSGIPRDRKKATLHELTASYSKFIM